MRRGDSWVKISKVINNNVISAFDENGDEVVVMGRGIGFQMKPGLPIDDEKVNKVFRITDKQASDKFKTLLREVPIEVAQITEKVVSYTENKFGIKLNELIYVSLTDHLNYAIERHNKGIEIKHGLLWEIKKLYQEEYSIGLDTLEMVDELLGVQLPEDEAAFIAMHIVNAIPGGENSNVHEISKMVQSILSIVKYQFQRDFDEESIDYFRFVTHLKFFAQRILTKKHLEQHDNMIYDILKNKNPKAYNCTIAIDNFIRKEYDYKITNDEKLYLIMHIQRVFERQ